MPRTEQEERAVRHAKGQWRVYAGCGCIPQEVPEGRGYDLECRHKHVEVKGTKERLPGFRYLTSGEFNAARTDKRFELWLITSHTRGRHTLYIIPRWEVVALAKLAVQWMLLLGKDRLGGFREIAVKRQQRWRSLQQCTGHGRARRTRRASARSRRHPGRTSELMQHLGSVKSVLTAGRGMIQVKRPDEEDSWT